MHVCRLCAVARSQLKGNKMKNSSCVVVVVLSTLTIFLPSARSVQLTSLSSRKQERKRFFFFPRSFSHKTGTNWLMGGGAGGVWRVVWSGLLLFAAAAVAAVAGAAVGPSLSSSPPTRHLGKNGASFFFPPPPPRVIQGAALKKRGKKRRREK